MILDGDDADAYIVWLIGSNLKEPMYGKNKDLTYKKFFFKDLLPGKYIIKLDPDEESWDSHCVFYKHVKIENKNLSIKIKPPNKKLKLKVSFKKSREPNASEFGKHIVARIDLIKDGKIDPIYKQWLFCEKKNEKWIGTLYYLMPGEYRITFFDRDSRKDMASKDVKITDKILKQKKLELIY